MSKYKILTDSGWQEFDGIRKINNQDIIEITLENNQKICCTKDHRIYINLFQYVEASLLKKDDYIFTKNGVEKIISINLLGKQDVYDILNVQNGNKFYANNILVHNCEFIGKSNSLIDAMILRQKILEANNKTYLQVIDNDVRIYTDINPWKKYLVAIDTSMGTDGDFAAIQVFSTPNLEQVAEWQSDKLNQNNQIEKLKTIIDWLYKEIKKNGNKNPEIYWSLENNGSAEGFICALRELESQLGTTYIKNGTLINENGNKRIGFTTTSRTKPMACSQLKILFESNRFKINSREYLIQLSNFAAKSALSYSAKGDGHDDLITSSLTIILMYLQNKNANDLDMEIIPHSKQTIDNKGYFEMPFLFDSY